MKVLPQEAAAAAGKGMGERATAPVDPGVVSLIAGIAAGDTRALGEFYEEWFDRAFDLARQLTRRDESFCLDVVQDAMMKVIRKLRPGLGIMTRGSLEAWFARVVHTTAIDLLRREARRRRREAAPAASARGEAPASADEVAHLEERITWLSAEVRRLDSGEASMVAMRYLQERSLEAVGEEHGMTGAAAHGRLRRLLGRLRIAGKERFHD